MLIDITGWIESHEVTVGLLKGLAVIFIAWIGGVFAYLKRFRAKPYLRLVETASFALVERIPATSERPDGVRTSFIINVSLVNASNERVVLDQFELSYRTIGYWRSYRQRLLRIAFPSRPRKQVGEGLKYMGVWFTEYPLGDLKMDVIKGALDPKDQCGGFLLFTSFTYGTWNPRIENHQIRVRLKAGLTSHQQLSVSARFRVSEDMKIAEEFSPGFAAHVAHESTWNHDLSLISR